MEQSISEREVKCPVCGRKHLQGLVHCVKYLYKKVRLDGFSDGPEKYVDFSIRCPYCDYFFYDSEAKEEDITVKTFVMSEKYKDILYGEEYPERYRAFMAQAELAHLKKD